MKGVITLIESGGIFMIPLFLLSLTAFALIIERSISRGKWKKSITQFILFLEKKGKQGSKLDLNIPTNFFKITLANQEILAQEYLQTLFEKRLRNYQLITTIGNVAPLLGFIGTISGMIRSFSSIANADTVSVKLVAGGISEALVTTGFGLIIAVICVLGESIGRYYFTLFVHQVEDRINILYKK